MYNERSLEQWVSVEVADDYSTASIQITARIPDVVRLTANDIVELLHQHGVRYGINHDKVEQLVRAAGAWERHKLVIAVGDPPGEGIDGYIRNLSDPEARSIKPLEQKDGTVDYKEVTRLANVRKGQLIAERIPPREGAPGMDVRGEIIPGRLGKDVRFKLGRNVVADPDQKALYAATDGMVALTEQDKINVFPVFEVEGDVDYRIGHIDFLGTVVIRGNVLSGFKVKAAGDIRITGGVESAEVVSNGSIDIGAGILGHNKAVIRAGVDVISAYIQDALVIAERNVVVSQSILHAQVRAGKAVVCNGSKGLIVGGTIQAGERVTARTIGNTMSTPTMIEVGVLPELRNELSSLRVRLRQVQEGLDKTDKALVLLNQLAAAGALTPEKLAMRIKLTHTRKQASDEAELMKERILEMEKKLEETDKASVEVVSAVYGGTKVVLGRYTRFVKDYSPRVRFVYAEGDIAMLPNV